MKKIYCKYCGLELENGKCSCKSFAKESVSTNLTKGVKICDTCKKAVDKDSVYCPYCGLPLNINGNIQSLQDELAGKNAKDVMKVYFGEKKNIIKKVRSNFSDRTWALTIVLVVLLSIFSIMYFVMPYINKSSNNTEMSEYLKNDESVESIISNTYDIENSSREDTIQPIINKKEGWVMNDGFYYSFDENGDPVVDDWVLAKDENGNEEYYYFDIDGKLVVNSWIDGEYYVGADGVMLRDQATPDGAYVDENGKVVVNDTEGVRVTKETKVYYESPYSTETKAASTQRSQNSGDIKGVDPEKTYQIYVKSINQRRDKVAKGEDKCNITYYVPTVDGVDEREIERMNEALKEAFTGEFMEKLKDRIRSVGELPKSVTFNTVEQRNVTNQRIVLIIHGTVVPRKGLKEKIKYRFVYDRKSRQLMITEIP